MTDISRRGFFKRLGVATAAAVIAAQVGEDVLGAIDPERLLWVPGAKKIIDLGSQKLISPAPAPEVKLLTDEDVLRDFIAKVEATPHKSVDPELRSQADKILGIGRLVRTQRLAVVSSGGYGEFTFRDGKLEGGQKALDLLRKVDKPFLAPDRMGIRYDRSYDIERDYRDRKSETE
jgi:hypothetical protein